MNTVSGKVNVPTSRDIMGSAKGAGKLETPVNYEHELDGVTLASDLDNTVAMWLGPYCRFPD